MRTREISVFIDESGSYEPDRVSSRYYLVCMVFHDQDIDISDKVAKLESSLESIGLDSRHCVHAGPLIRHEKEYADMNRETRRGIFRRMFLFLSKVDVSYKCFVIDKNFIGGAQDVHDTLLQQIVRFLLSKSDELSAYDKLKVYYDNGQPGLTALLKEAFSIFASRTEFVPDVEPTRYRLFQAADIACTLELARAKLVAEEGLSASENTFFGGVKNFKKNYLKLLEKRRID